MKSLPDLNEKLIHAATAGDAEMVGMLLKEGADKEIKAKDGQTLLHIAARKDRGAVVAMLIQAGTDKEVRHGESWTPLHFAAMFGNAEICSMLVQAGADKEAKDKTGRTPLLLAAMGGHAPTVGALIQANADKEAKDEDGMTSLHFAAFQGYVSTVQALIQAGANKEAKREGRTPRDLAVIQGHTSVVAIFDGLEGQKQTSDNDKLAALANALAKVEKAESDLKTSIMQGFAVADDHRSGAFEARRKNWPMIREELDKMEALLPQWTTLSPKQKDSFPSRIAVLRETSVPGVPGEPLRKERDKRLRIIEQDWHLRKRADTLASFALLRGQVEKLESLPVNERRTLLQTAKLLRSKDCKHLENQEHDQLTQLIAGIRKRVNAKWWEFWL